MKERIPTNPGSDTPKIGQSLDGHAPILDRIEQELRSSRGLLKGALIAGIVFAAGVAGSAVYFSRSSGGEVPSSSGPCVPGENQLDCLDRLHDEEVAGHPIPAVLPGLDVDGCSVLSDADQLRSPLCCPVVSRNPSACPRPAPGMGMAVEGGEAVILDADDLVPASEAPSE